MFLLGLIIGGCGGAFLGLLVGALAQAAGDADHARDEALRTDPATRAFGHSDRPM